jgi:hypothetical protein
MFGLKKDRHFTINKAGGAYTPPLHKSALWNYKKPSTIKKKRKETKYG